MTRPRRGLRRVWVRQALACFVVLVAMASSAGASQLRAGQPSSSQWASTTCGAVATWLHRVEKGTGNAPDTSNPGATKEAVVGFVDNISQATHSLLTKLRRVKAPNTPNGKSSAASVTDAVARLSTAIDSAGHSADSLSTDDPGQLRTQLNRLARQLQDGVNAAQQGLQEVVSSNSFSNELSRALTGAKQCKSILSP
jgi:hypothetical protein